MKVSMKWLGRWVDTQGLELDELAQRLTMQGLEHEGTEHIGAGADGVVVGQITSIEAHPKADRLVICQLDIADDQPHQIVCGATNMKVGDRVPVALPGSQVPSFDFEIGERKMRGVLSQGMLCSGDELGVPDGVDGLLILPEHLTLGQPFFDALELRDDVLELSLTPNRPDCLNHRGVAREVAAAYERALVSRTEDDAQPLWASSGHTAVGELASLDVQDAQGCPGYALAVIEGVKVGPSPEWLRIALSSVGLRSINNVVDITNYVMMDVGQPLHAFDLDKLEGQSVVVRRAHKGEAFVGIDHKSYELSEQDLVIADAKGAVAIAGVMGGQGSEVDASTSRVLIECAYFDPTTVRKSAKRHSLHTDSSHRYERGTDPGALQANLQRAVELLVKAQSVDVHVAEGHLMVQAEAPQAHIIEMKVGMPDRILGTSLDASRVIELLQSIELEVEAKGDHLLVHAPTYRPDLERPIDVVEEVARLIGFDQLPSRLPSGIMGAVHTVRKDAKHAPTLPGQVQRARQRGVAQLLLSQGINQAVNFSFMGSAELERLGVEKGHALWDVVAVANPMNEEQEMMRTSLLPGLIRNVEHNVAQRQKDIALFEIGRVYLPTRERLCLGIALTGKRAHHWSAQTAWDFYDLKGLVEAAGKAMGIHGGSWSVPSALESYLHPGVQAQWEVDGQVLAHIGQLHPSLKVGEQPVFWACVWLDDMSTRDVYVPGFDSISKYPAVTRDFAFVQSKSAPFSEIEQALESLRAQDEQIGELMTSYSVFDVYEGEHVEQGSRSIALEVTFQSKDGTLTDDQIQHVHQAVVQHVQREANVTLRT